MAAGEVYMKTGGNHLFYRDFADNERQLTASGITAPSTIDGEIYVHLVGGTTAHLCWSRHAVGAFAFRPSESRSSHGTVGDPEGSIWIDGQSINFVYNSVHFRYVGTLT